MAALHADLDTTYLPTCVVVVVVGIDRIIVWICNVPTARTGPCILSPAVLKRPRIDLSPNRMMVLGDRPSESSGWPVRSCVGGWHGPIPFHSIPLDFRE